MSTSSVDRPGIREQHLLRKRDNPVFDEAQRSVSNELLTQARLQDGLERDRFMEAFQSLIQRAAELNPNTPSETILELKEELDRSYQQACALPGDHEQIKTAIGKLLAVIMQAVWKGVGNDDFARQQLKEEESARQVHFELQQLPLVSALTHSDSPIAENELIPSLLSEPETTLGPTLQVFDNNQIASIAEAAERYLQQHDPGRTLSGPWNRLAFIQAYHHALEPESAAN